MFDYTGYENQVKQMKAAGLNPALINGGSGSAGQAHGATVSPATAMQPMGLQVALQAQQAAAQTALTNAQAEKIRSETTFVSCPNVQDRLENVFATVRAEAKPLLAYLFSESNNYQIGRAHV